MSLKIIFTILSLIFGLGVFLPYYLNILKGKARPHLFSWLTWGILTGLGFFLSRESGGGGGAWVFGMQTILCLGVALYAILRGKMDITRIDWVFFFSALAVTFFYIFTKNAAVSVLLAATADFLAFLPTFRKSYSKPYDEPVLTYLSSLLSFAFSIGALQMYSFTTMFYPLSIVASNTLFISFLLIRRKK